MSIATAQAGSRAVEKKPSSREPFTLRRGDPVVAEDAHGKERDGRGGRPPRDRRLALPLYRKWTGIVTGLEEIVCPSANR
jgi:hypothetical protein